MRAAAFAAAALLALLLLAAGEPRAVPTDAASSDSSYGVAVDSAAPGAQPRDASAAAARSIDAPTMPASIAPETAPRSAGLEARAQSRIAGRYVA